MAAAVADPDDPRETPGVAGTDDARDPRPGTGRQVPPENAPPLQTVRLRLLLSYDGTDFSGWATQPGLRTVQQVVEDALTTVLRLPRPARLTVAGRTDSGVHARGQVAQVDIPAQAWRDVVGRSDRAPGAALVARMSGLLGRSGRPRGTSDVVVHDAAVAPAGFDARFSAIWRRYTYRIADAAAVRDPLRRRDVLWHRSALDVEAMDTAAQWLCGEHDFASYCRPREGATTIRALQQLRWRRVPAGERDGGLVVASVQADAFCHSMVRALVGAAIAVGEGRRPVSWPAEVLAAGRRDPSVGVSPAHGLTLEVVGYPPAAELATRASAARNRRTLPPR